MLTERAHGAALRWREWNLVPVTILATSHAGKGTPGARVLVLVQGSTAGPVPSVVRYVHAADACGLGNGAAHCPERIGLQVIPTKIEDPKRGALPQQSGQGKGSPGTGPANAEERQGQLLEVTGGGVTDAPEESLREGVGHFHAPKAQATHLLQFVFDQELLQRLQGVGGELAVPGQVQASQGSGPLERMLQLLQPRPHSLVCDEVPRKIHMEPPGCEVAIALGNALHESGEAPVVELRIPHGDHDGGGRLLTLKVDRTALARQAAALGEGGRGMREGTGAEALASEEINPSGHAERELWAAEGHRGVYWQV
mmetsp:Transcript_64514/g.138339  ORF Transcript_64514/g.138339 Transcript_64514/m.138339 type:complete len:312 (+) Transcript_64514:173-1108(+)